MDGAHLPIARGARMIQSFLSQRRRDDKVESDDGNEQDDLRGFENERQGRSNQVGDFLVCT